MPHPSYTNESGLTFPEKPTEFENFEAILICFGLTFEDLKTMSIGSKRVVSHLNVNNWHAHVGRLCKIDEETVVCEIVDDESKLPGYDATDNNRDIVIVNINTKEILEGDLGDWTQNALLRTNKNVEKELEGRDFSKNGWVNVKGNQKVIQDLKLARRLNKV
jgi:hypothetical protein